MVLVADRCVLALLVLAAALLLCRPVTSAAAPADDVKSLVESNRSAEAYALGRQNPDSLGDPVFDFYFGIAAIDTGHAGEGVLALERYLLNFPDNVSARLQLARGYFTLGEDARAREEFEAVQKLGPPSDIAATVERYLDAIRLRETRYRTSAGAYIELGVGTDSNVNGGVPNANITLPTLGPITVVQNGMKISDSFTTVGAGGYVSHPVAPGVSLFANGQGELKTNSKESDRQFDLGNYNVTGGVSWLREKNIYRLSITDGLITLGSARYRETNGAAVEWQYQLDELQALNLGAQAARLSYAGPYSPYDADFTGYNAGYRRLFSYPWRPILSLGVSTGHEKSLVERPDLVRNLAGANAAVSFTPAAKWGVSLGYSFQQSHYEAPDLILGETRRDKYEAYIASVSYLYTANLSFRAEAVSSRNRSNIELYDFPRDIVSFKVRYEFK